MAASIIVEQKRRGRPSTGQDRNIGVRLPDNLVTRIDAWAAANQTTRSKAIRILVQSALSIAEGENTGDLPPELLRIVEALAQARAQIDYAAQRLQPEDTK